MATDAVPKGVKKFTVPAEFVRAFQGEVRFVPRDPHNNGYMNFDYNMLIGALRNADPAARERLAAALGSLETQWNLVLVSKSETIVSGD
ncbi:MAG TPA: hypothetical protein VKU19_35970 [Bryobacteraceae bacterium]|nr:hypothetical protein [Bryobacteraceae bacterium]